jgi:hypothetical protein
VRSWARNIPRIWRLLVCVVGALALFESRAAAEGSKTVRVVASGNPSVAAALEVVVRELLGRLSVALDWSIAIGIDPRAILVGGHGHAEVIARAWIDVSDPTRARIYVANGQNERFILRFVPLENGYDEIAREELAHIVESSVDAFASGGAVGVSREVAEREVAREVRMPSSPPRRQASKPESAHLALALAYQGSLRAGDPIIAQGPLLDVAIAFQGESRVRFCASARAEYDTRLTWRSRPVGALFEGGAVAITAGAEVSVMRTFVVRALAGAGTGLTRVTPFAQSATTAMPSYAFWRTSPFGRVGVDATFDLFGPFALLVGVGCDVDLVHTAYELVRSGVQSQVISPWIAHPFSYAGALIALDRHQ